MSLEKVNLENLNLESEMDSELLDFLGNVFKTSAAICINIAIQFVGTFSTLASPGSTSPKRATNADQVSMVVIEKSSSQNGSPRFSSERQLDESLNRSDSVLLEQTEALGEAFPTNQKLLKNPGHARLPVSVNSPRIKKPITVKSAATNSEIEASSSNQFLATSKVTMENSIARDIRSNSLPIATVQEQLGEFAKLQAVEQVKASIKVKTTGSLIAENCIGIALSNQDFSLPSCELKSCSISFDAYFVTPKRGPISCFPPFVGPRLFQPISNNDLMC